MRFIRGLLLAIFIILPLGVLPASSQSPITAKIIPTDDAHVDSINEDINYKNADLEVSYWDSSFGIWEEISYLAFIIDLPSDANITTIVLKLAVKLFPSDGHTVHLNIHETANFSEATLTYNNRPALFGQVGFGDIDGKSTWSFPIGTILSSPNTSYFLALTTNTDHITGISFEFPRLEITYTSAQNPANAGTTEFIFVILTLTAVYGIRKLNRGT